MATLEAIGRPGLVRTFRVPVLLTLAILAAVLYWRGSQFATTVVILSVLEFVFSFDNAVVNSKILGRMSPVWQTVFLTVGIAVAVFGMRFAFPILIVVTTAHLGVGQTWDLAVNHPEQYKVALEAAHPAIVGLAATFLSMIFLDWLFEERELMWLGPIERFLQKAGKTDVVSSMIALLALAVVSLKFSNGHTAQMLTAGLIGWLAYQGVNLLSLLTEKRAEELGDDPANIKLAAGAAGFGLFMQLEFIDASFSFDGVSGAFAITSDFFAIMIGLSIGALFIRSLTVYLTRQGTLGKYVFLEHGAHWAIGSLAFILFVTVEHEVSEYITGGIGIGFILLAYLSSLLYRGRHRYQGEDEAQELDAQLRSVPVRD